MKRRTVKKREARFQRYMRKCKRQRNDRGAFIVTYVNKWIMVERIRELEAESSEVSTAHAALIRGLMANGLAEYCQRLPRDIATVTVRDVVTVNEGGDDGR
jgi:hypothetical protein